MTAEAPTGAVMIAAFSRAVDEAAGRYVCAECEGLFYGPPVMDEFQLFWTPRAAQVWCSTDCHTAACERAGMRP